jgi:endonuclease/exonuclease/phosphatase family metal-dependent hydrolase
MQPQPLLASLPRTASRILGAVFCALLTLSLSSCDQKPSTADWSAAEKKTPVTAPAKAPIQAEGTAQVAHKATSHGGLRFITYNVENWLTTDRYLNGKTLKGAPKPDSEKQACVQILARHFPDVLGLCEVGTRDDLAEIQGLLKAAGLDLPHAHYSGGADPVRHLALLSRFPITSTAQAAEMTYQLEGQTFAINRGILDASLSANGQTYRFIGAHLKSKRDSEQGDQEDIRINEARLLRRHVDALLRENADARLIIYGDLNDTRGSPPIKLLAGKYNDPTYLTAIPAKDSHGDAWTQHWSLHDIYSRFDYIMVSHALRPEVDFPEAKILDDPEWAKASDHRAVLALFK